jgi:hypothetical protein
MPRSNLPATSGRPPLPAVGDLGSSSLGFALPDDVAADLLRAQTEQIATPQQLVQVKIMNGGAGLYEFGDTNDTVREFRGIIVSSYARNVLWDRPFGSEPRRDPVTNEEIPNSPACVSSNGIMGVPRPGFAHAALGGRVATGVEQVQCSTCPYNQWESKTLIGGTGKGKAVTNQRAVFIMVLGPDGEFERDSPVELTLPPTSLPTYDEYLASLVNRRIPVQAVVTTFRQERVNKNGFQWGVAQFSVERAVTELEFRAIMEKRAAYRSNVLPQDTAPRMEAGEVVGGGVDDEEDVPF